MRQPQFIDPSKQKPTLRGRCSAFHCKAAPLRSDTSYNMFTLLVYCIAIILCSALGGAIPAILRLTHRRTQLILSFVSGVMLGVATLNLLPHSIFALKNPSTAMGTCLGGLLFMFFMIRTFHFHQHDLHVEHSDEEVCGHSCAHESHDHGQGAAPDFTWAGLCFGLAIHSIVDGVALATAVTAQNQQGWTPAGLAVFLAIFLHKPLDALSITSLMAAKGWHVNTQFFINVMFALVCPLSALLFALGVNFLIESPEQVLGYSLAFSAGIFLCISLGDLLPELHFHSHDRLKLSAMLLLGVLVAVLIEILPGHDHQWSPDPDNSTAIIENITAATKQPLL